MTCLSPIKCCLAFPVKWLLRCRIELEVCISASASSLGGLAQNTKADAALSIISPSSPVCHSDQGIMFIECDNLCSVDRSTPEAKRCMQSMAWQY